MIRGAWAGIGEPMAEAPMRAEAKVLVAVLVVVIRLHQSGDLIALGDRAAGMAGLVSKGWLVGLARIESAEGLDVLLYVLEIAGDGTANSFRLAHHQASVPMSMML